MLYWGHLRVHGGLASTAPAAPEHPPCGPSASAGARGAQVWTRIGSRTRRSPGRVRAGPRASVELNGAAVVLTVLALLLRGAHEAAQKVPWKEVHGAVRATAAPRPLPDPRTPPPPTARDRGLARQQQPNRGAPSGGLSTETRLPRPETQGSCWGREGRRPRCLSRGRCTATRTGLGGSRAAGRQVTRSHVNAQVTQSQSDVTVPKATRDDVNCCGPCQDGHFSFLPNFYPKNHHVNRKAKFKKCAKPTREGEQQTKGGRRPQGKSRLELQ